MAKPLVTVIIAAFNSENKINKTLEALLNQTYKNIEIIVVDDGSEDKTKEVVKEFFKKNKKIKLLEQHRQGPGAAKNLAAKKAKGKIFVFVDSDEYPRKDYIEKLTKPLITKKGETAIGAWYVANPKSVWARCRFKDSGEIRKHAVKSGVFRTISKKDFNKIGGFDPKKGYSDDQTGKTLKRIRVDSAIFDHDVDSSLSELFKKRKWIGSSIISNPKPRKFWIKLILGFVFLMIFVNSLFFSRRLSLILIIIALLPLLYQTIKKIIFYKDIRLLIAYPAYSIVCSIGMLMGFLKPEYKK